MTVDIQLLRAEKGGDPQAVKDSEIRRGRDGNKIVDDVVEADQAWRKLRYDYEQCLKDAGDIGKAVSVRKKADSKDDCADLVAKSTNMKQVVIPQAKKNSDEMEMKRDALLKKIGNVVHQSVPISTDEANNLIVRTWGRVEKGVAFDGTPGKMHHHTILEKLQGVEFRKARELVGHRGYFLKGVGVMLNMAIIQYGLRYLRQRGYTALQPPFFMRKEVMSQTAELADFEETLYRIPVKEGKDDRDDLFLIATSEQPISALHRGEFIEEKQLPLRYSGFSSCFRKEAGSSGRDMWGLFRIHQFEKEESWDMQEEMISSAEGFYQSLGLPYRIVSIVSGALNDAAAKKYDLEAWFPGHDDYRELVSCSNCTDYQSRSLNVRLGHPKMGDREKKFVHMLNATLVASERCLCCVLENYQTPEGVRVPRALVPYMDGVEFLPYPTTTDDKVQKNVPQQPQ